MKFISPRLKIFVMSHAGRCESRCRGFDAQRCCTQIRTHSETLRGAEACGGPGHSARKNPRILASPLSSNFLRLAAAPADLPLPQNLPHGRVILTVSRWLASKRCKGAEDENNAKQNR